jgi:hypothetical protein
MPAKKTKRVSSKVTARKHGSTQKRGMGVAAQTGFGEHVARELTLDPLQRPGESVVDAARRLWLSAQSLVTSPGVTRRKSRREGRGSR